jgi:hypothetical protein
MRTTIYSQLLLRNRFLPIIPKRTLMLKPASRVAGQRKDVWSIVNEAAAAAEKPVVNVSCLPLSLGGRELMMGNNSSDRDSSGTIRRRLW